MTAIAGVFPSTQKKALNRDLRDALLAKISFRGPDGLSDFHDEDILLVHAHLGKGPKANTFDEPRHPVIVAGDIRVDNRSDLISMLDLQKDAVTSDAHLVRAAFLRWGPSCFEKLVGDFAMAIWDDREKALYCCRDHFGVRPLYYQENSGTFSFATEAKILPGYRPNTFSEDYLAAFLGAVPFNEPETAHTGIFRLMPGHWLRRKNGRTTITKYWELEIEPISPADPAAEFRDIFDTAVADRMCDPRQLATFLSGGLDSSAITGVAERILSERHEAKPLRTYSVVYDDNRLLDERPYINDVLATGRYDPKFLPMDHYQSLKGIEKVLDDQEGLFNAPGLMKSTHLYDMAARDGIDVILDGHGGDEVVGYGTGRMWELANAGQWFALIPLARTHSKLFNSSSLALYLQLLEGFGSGKYHTRAARLLIRQVVRLMTSQPKPNTFAWEGYLAPAYVKAMDLHDRSRRIYLPTPEQRISDQHLQLRGLVFPGTASAFELLDKSSAAAGVEVRYPFFDVRLVQFCLGLASSEKLRRNETRSILRRAMKDIYPASVARRQDKTNFLPELANGLVHYHDDILREMTLDRDGRLGQYVNMDKLREGVDKLRQNPAEMDGGDVMFFWRIATLHIWFSRSSIRTEPPVNVG